MLIIEHLPRQVAEMARSDVGRRLSLQEGVVAAIGLVLGDDDEDRQQPDHPDNEPAEPSRKKVGLHRSESGSALPNRLSEGTETLTSLRHPFFIR